MKTKKTANDPFKDVVLDEEESRLEEALGRGEYQSVDNLEETKKFFEEAARNHKELQESKPITIRINKEDLIKVKSKAKESGLPYQTLLSALIHQFADGKTGIKIS